MQKITKNKSRKFWRNPLVIAGLPILALVGLLVLVVAIPGYLLLCLAAR